MPVGKKKKGVAGGESAAKKAKSDDVDPKMTSEVGDQKTAFAEFWRPQVDSMASAALVDLRERKNKSRKVDLEGLGNCTLFPGVEPSTSEFVQPMTFDGCFDGWGAKLVENFHALIAECESSDEAIALTNCAARYKDICAITRNSKCYRTIYMAQILAHLISSKNLIIGNKKKLEAAEVSEDGIKEDLVESCRDQGFVRPNVLILCPYKKDAYEIVHIMRKLIYGDAEAGNVWNKSRFEDEFSGGQKAADLPPSLPDDHKELLAGNNDDTFRMGIALSKKTLKLFERFDNSDVLLCSPLGLRMILNGDDGDEAHLISCMQIVVVDRADLLLQQNWEHLQLIFSHMHNLPAKIDMDISRVRRLYLDGYSRHYSQLMVFSRHPHELVTSLAVQHSTCHRGLVFNGPKQAGTLADIEIPLCQELHRFDVQDAADVSAARWKYFCDKILQGLATRTCVVVPSYFDFVRMRNHLKRAEESFVACHEYAPKSKVLRARDLFFHEKKSYLLVTERFYFFNRRHLRGIHRLVFYQLPSYPPLYAELINMAESEDASRRFLAVLLYCRQDRVRLENTFGTEMATSIIASPLRVQAIVSE